MSRKHAFTLLLIIRKTFTIFGQTNSKTYHGRGIWTTESNDPSFIFGIILLIAVVAIFVALFKTTSKKKKTIIDKSVGFIGSIIDAIIKIYKIGFVIILPMALGDTISRYSLLPKWIFIVWGMTLTYLFFFRSFSEHNNNHKDTKFNLYLWIYIIVSIIICTLAYYPYTKNRTESHKEIEHSSNIKDKKNNTCKVKFITDNNTNRGFQIDYPESWKPIGAPSKNGDKKSFTDSKGAKLTVVSSKNILDEKLSASYHRMINNENYQVTYKVLRDKWYVVSGYRISDNNIFYIKVFRSEDDMHEQMMHLTFPQKRHNEMEDIVPIISKSFKNIKTNDDQIKFITYYNPSRDFQIDYPEHWKPIGDGPMNGDGRSFTDGKGIKLTTASGRNVLEEKLSVRFNRMINNENYQVTYKILRDKWYVVSGYRISDNDIFYIKVFRSEDDMHEQIMHLTFPKKRHNEMKDIVPIISKSFKNIKTNIN